VIAIFHPVRGILLGLVLTFVGVDLLAHGVKHPHDWELITWGGIVLSVSLAYAGACFRVVILGLFRLFF
jgi:hypothetical protein